MFAVNPVSVVDRLVRGRRRIGRNELRREVKNSELFLSLSSD